MRTVSTAMSESTPSSIKEAVCAIFRPKISEITPSTVSAILSSVEQVLLTQSASISDKLLYFEFYSNPFITSPAPNEQGTDEKTEQLLNSLKNELFFVFSSLLF